MKKVYILLIVLCILNALDYFITILALGHGALEGNAIVGYFIEHNAFHWFKIIGVGLLCIYLIHASKRDQKSKSRITKLLLGADIAYSLIVVSNAVTFFIQNNIISF